MLRGLVFLVLLGVAGVAMGLHTRLCLCLGGRGGTFFGMSAPKFVWWTACAHNTTKKLWEPMCVLPYYLPTLPRRRGLDLIVLGLGVCTVWVVQGRGQRGRVRFKQWW